MEICRSSTTQTSTWAHERPTCGCRFSKWCSLQLSDCNFSSPSLSLLTLLSSLSSHLLSFLSLSFYPCVVKRRRIEMSFWCWIDWVIRIEGCLGSVWLGSRISGLDGGWIGDGMALAPTRFRGEDRDTDDARTGRDRDLGIDHSRSGSSGARTGKS